MTRPYGSKVPRFQRGPPTISRSSTGFLRRASVSTATIALVTITCATDWSTQGATRIVKSPSSIIAAWDVVFFDLAREAR
jgi:hypothetical protein